MTTTYGLIGPPLPSLTNNPNLAFSSLETEKFRVYEYPNDTFVRIDNPQYLHVSKSGGHRVLDGAGVAHYIPEGWYHLYWEVKEGAPAFSF